MKQLLQKSVEVGREEGIRSLVNKSSGYVSQKGTYYYYRIMPHIIEKQTLETTRSSAEFYVDSWKEYECTNTPTSEEVLIDDIISTSQETDVVYDVGAGIGTHSCLIAPYVSRVIAFEPHPLNVEKCRANAELNIADVRVVGVALSNSSRVDELKLHVDVVGDAGHTLVFDSDEADVETTEVSVEPGDELIGGSEIPPPNILKIDAEGEGMNVLKGLEKAIASDACQHVYIEIHPQEDRDDIETYLKNNGFDTNIIDNRGNAEFMRASVP